MGGGGGLNPPNCHEVPVCSSRKIKVCEKERSGTWCCFDFLDDIDDIN